MSSSKRPQVRIKKLRNEQVEELIFASASSDADSLHTATIASILPHKPPVKARHRSIFPSDSLKVDHHEMSSISITTSEFDELITHAFADESPSHESPSERERLVHVQTLRDSAQSLDEPTKSCDQEPLDSERDATERNDEGQILQSGEENVNAVHQTSDFVQAAGYTPLDCIDSFLNLDSGVMSPPPRKAKGEKRSTAVRKKRYVTWHSVSSADFNQVQYHVAEEANVVDSTPFSSRITLSSSARYSQMAHVEQRHAKEADEMDKRSGNKGFVRYSSCVRRQFRQLYPDHSNKEIMNLIANAWRNLSEAEKNYFRSPTFTKQLRFVDLTADCNPTD